MSKRLSNSSLPSYVAGSVQDAPTYSAEPQDSEQRIAHVRHRPTPSGTFVKQGKGGDMTITLSDQDKGVELPLYGRAAMLEGMVEIKPQKSAGVNSVDVKIAVRLRLQELGEGGEQNLKITLAEALLWRKSLEEPVCPDMLPFRLELPTQFVHGGQTYALPPTFYAKLSGLPGFIASTDYTLTATALKGSVSSFVRTAVHKAHIGEIFVSTPFTYHPRSAPAIPLPMPIPTGLPGLPEPGSGWTVWRGEVNFTRGELTNRYSSAPPMSLVTRFYLPSSRAFCMRQPIPFFLKIESSAQSLAIYLPLAPNPNNKSPRDGTRVQLLRQSTIDVGGEFQDQGGVKTDIWRVDSLGEGTFTHAGESSTGMAFTGEIVIADWVKTSGFRAIGLSTQDCILFSISPREGKKGPFDVFRQIIPVKLTTDMWAADGRGISAGSFPHTNGANGTNGTNGVNGTNGHHVH